MEIIGGGDVTGRLPRPLIALAIRHSGAHPRPSHPTDEGSTIVIPTFAALGKRHPTKFRVPQDQGVFEQPAGSEVLKKSGNRKICRRAHGREFLSHIGMVVPIARGPAGTTPNLDEANPALHQPAGHQAASTKLLRFRAIHAIKPASGRTFYAQIEGLRRTQLHAGSQLVGLDSGFQTRVGIIGFEVPAIPLLEQGQPFATGLRRNA